MTIPNDDHGLYVVPEVYSQTKHTIKTTKWKGTTLLKTHSLIQAVDKCTKMAAARQIVVHGITGIMDSGKTTLAQTIAHMMHRGLDEQYGIHMDVVHWGADETRELDTNISQITRNTILILDDISNVHKTISSKQWNKVLETITTIRHREGGDIKIVLMFSYHYTKALDKMLRTVQHFTWQTSVSLQEMDNYLQIYQVNRNNTRYHINVLNTMSIEGADSGYFGPKNNAYTNDKAEIEKRKREGKTNYPQLYKWEQPFRPVLFYDRKSIHTVIYPKREWINPSCEVCGYQTGNTTAELDREMANVYDIYGPNTITAVRSELIRRGHKIHTGATAGAVQRIKELHAPLEYLIAYYERHKQTKHEARLQAEGRLPSNE